MGKFSLFVLVSSVTICWSHPIPRPLAMDPGDVPLWCEVSHGKPQNRPIFLGAHSARLRQLVVRVLGKQYPCAAVALLRFDEADTRHVPSWEMVSAGAPTSRTAGLIANGAASADIQRTLNRPWPGPYGMSGGLFISSSITTETLSTDQSRSTITTGVIDGEGLPVSPGTHVEPIVRVVWSNRDFHLIAIYASVP